MVEKYIISGTNNLALYKPTYQIDSSHGGRPGRAIDGNKDTDWDHMSCTRTPNIQEPWWIVDLYSHWSRDNKQRQ